MSRNVTFWLFGNHLVDAQLFYIYRLNSELKNHGVFRFSLFCTKYVANWIITFARFHFPVVSHHWWLPMATTQINSATLYNVIILFLYCIVKFTKSMPLQPTDDCSAVQNSVCTKTIKSFTWHHMEYVPTLKHFVSKRQKDFNTKHMVFS